MATASKSIAYPHISASPGVRGGRPCIDGTRISVMDVVTLDRNGLSPKEIRTHFSSRQLTLAEVHAALTYYYDHRDEIDACFAEDREWDEGHDERRAEHLRKRTRR